jgi:hypothetical protein
MAQDDTKKEALFNEVKGSLFEYLVARKIATQGEAELLFQRSLDQNYLTVLSQQDRMVRQFYPEMLTFLDAVSTQTTSSIIEALGEVPREPRLTGKFSNSEAAGELSEADLLVQLKGRILPLSLKLNKKNAFVNTKSGGIKSFFLQYFSFLSSETQVKFNQLVDREFSRMGAELYGLHEMEWSGGFAEWVQLGHSELPGELERSERALLHAYYARISLEMQKIFEKAKEQDPVQFGLALGPLMGLGRPDMLQVICFHDMKQGHEASIEIHDFKELAPLLDSAQIMPHGAKASVEIRAGHWTLQVRVKPMNKFTTTAIKINCSVRVLRPPSGA